MAKLIFKIASPGEGKTAWLVDKAFFEVGQGKKVFLLTSPDSPEYHKFISRYHINYTQSCPIEPVDSIRHIKPGSVVLIDDIFKFVNATSAINRLNTICDKVYITINGINGDKYTPEVTKVEEKDYEPVQISLFDDCVLA